VKLLFCSRCFDLFKLDFPVRSCSCGLVRGRYLPDGHTAEVNGEGLSLAIDNNTLVPFIRRGGPGPAEQYEEGMQRNAVTCWVREHEGPGNPRSHVNPEL
jgi:hypothetical protein